MTALSSFQVLNWSGGGEVLFSKLYVGGREGGDFFIDKLHIVI